ncbi:hypothetical protein JR316_0007250 [Psilocybe cubensis]|uniref:Uncharacterized protein n=2 Tax=Psilocybe cubensis TaxID=181762 RepID=A0ACB8H0C2_PSICU|nr:hypothetical protein JR316_0007250 [Psilocybe cubensis]KAH9480650.1 hypothetical protein JR316_0007250 [Psilocybe cubensis]
MASIPPTTSSSSGLSSQIPPCASASEPKQIPSIALSVDVKGKESVITAEAEAEPTMALLGAVKDQESDSEGDEKALVDHLGLDARCRIVVVSSSINAARAFVDSVIALSGGEMASSDKATDKEKDAEKEPKTPTAASTEPVVIPHTLTNRYYTAQVHFAVYTCAGLGRVLGAKEGEGEEDMPLFKSEVGEGGVDVGFKREFAEEFDGGSGSEITRAPGVVYVWADGEGEYWKELGGVVRGMERVGWEAEVCLAVRVGKGGGEDDEDVDGVVMGHGFEYVDGREEAGGDGDEGDVGRLPRVVDALSTVMWVSMQSKGKVNSHTVDAERDGIMRELLDAEEEETERVMERDMLTPFGRVGALGRKVSLGFEDEFVPGGYRSLGSDFGGSEGYPELDEVDDWDEPTQEEIEETAGRLFGGFRKAPEGIDLSSVLESLQSVKSDIAALPDGERRKMAARVALGLAYGLDIE